MQARHSSFQDVYLPILESISLVFQGLKSLAIVKMRLSADDLAVSRYDDIRWMTGQLEHLPKDVFRSVKARSEDSLADSVLAVHGKWELEQEEASTSEESIVYR